MLKIYDGNNVYPLTGITDYFIRHMYGGFDQLYFDISTAHELYQYVAEEALIEDEKNIYLIKGINERGAVSTINCELDLDDFKRRFHKKFKSETLTVENVVQLVLPDRWRLIDESYISIKRTVEIEGATDLDVLEKCMDTYQCVFKFSIKEKTVSILNPANFENLGCYFTDELNLTDISFKGSTSGYITRLYPYGKDGLSIASVNDGKEYVEDYTYTNKIVCGYWKDARYTVPANLKADAQEKLKSLAYPSRSYQCTVSDLARMSEDYKFLDIQMYTKATLIDRKRKNQIEHRIVEYQEYPETPEKNIVTLSTAAQRIETQMKKIQTDIKNESQTLTGAYQEAVRDATNLITGNNGGYVLLDPAEKPERILVMDNADKSKARNVWQWNKQGFGHSSNGVNGPYDTAITMDGKIMAAFILAGTMMLDRLYGGTLIIGGNGNTRGRIELRDVQDKTVVECNNGGILMNGGELRNINGKTEVRIVAGNLSFIYDGERVFGMHAGLETNQVGGDLIVDKDYFKIYVGSGNTLNEVLLVNNGLNPNSYEEKVIFRNSVRFTLRPVFGGGISFGNCTISQVNNNQMMFAYNGTSVFTAGYNTFTIQSLPGGTAHCWNNLDLHGKSLLNSSDERLKDNIRPCNKMALDTVNNINLYEFDWLTDGSHEDIGYVAQQVEEVEPDLAYIDQEGSYSVKESKLIRYLWKAVQELSEEIGVLKKQLSEEHNFNRYTRDEKVRYTSEYMKRNGGSGDADNQGNIS